MRSTRLHWTWLLVVIASAAGAGMSVAAVGCGEDNGVDIYTCWNPIMGRRAHTGEPDPCCHIDPCPEADAGTDADTDTEDSDGGPPCTGVCVEVRPAGWDDPGLVWFGPPGDEPSCPASAKNLAFDGFEGVEAEPATCACVCTPSSEGTCGLTTTFTVSSAACPGTGGALTPFNAPVGWDGSCTNAGAIPAGALCNGVPCVRSLTAASLVLTSEPTTCVPLTIEPLIDITPPKVKRAVRECRPPSESNCDDPGLVCAPRAPGFETCIFHEGDAACPAPYSQKHVVATGLDDNRHCTACSCGPPSGGICTAMLNVSTDGVCGAEVLSTQITSSISACFDISLPGVALGSKSVTDLQYVPGSCAVTGGASVGGVTPTGTATFCCLP